MDLFEAVLGKGSVFHVTWFSMTAWSLWQRRNRIREKQSSWPLHEVSMRAKNLVLEYFKIHKHPPKIQRRATLTRQLPPPVGFYKANFDAAYFGNSGIAGIGVVVRDCEGEIIAALSQKILEPYSVDVAETLACRRAVVFARELSLFSIIVEGDNMRIVQATSNKRENLTLFGHVIKEIHDSCSSFTKISFQHVRRDGNKLAHALARRAILSADTVVWVEELPTDLEDVFQMDLVDL